MARLIKSMCVDAVFNEVGSTTSERYSVRTTYGLFLRVCPIPLSAYDGEGRRRSFLYNPSDGGTALLCLN
jgi:hypothetical protein